MRNTWTSQANISKEIEDTDINHMDLIDTYRTLNPAIADTHSFQMYAEYPPDYVLNHWGKTLQ